MRPGIGSSSDHPRGAARLLTRHSFLEPCISLGAVRNEVGTFTDKSRRSLGCARSQARAHSDVSASVGIAGLRLMWRFNSNWLRCLELQELDRLNFKTASACWG